MLFNSPGYYFFLILIFCLYWLLSPRYQNLLLLLGSYLFYGLWDFHFLYLIFLCSLSAHVVSQKIFNEKNQSRKKFYLGIGIAVNFASLLYFKYFNFFIDSLQSLLSLAGISSGLNYLDVVLPVGISFFTFQAATFIIDVYKDKIKSIPSVIDFFLYISFFPQLVAGPIERATFMLPQITKKRTFDTQKAEEGIVYISYGLFKKVAIADTLAVYVDNWYGAPMATPGYLLLLGTIFFAIQIYCDFSGYSDIALGSARLLGFELSRNFYFPYFSRNPAEFWRRWHITLMTWFKDYLYIPLGGGRCSSIRKIVNIMIVFLVSGLWHGASWNFVIWGGLNGVYVSIHNICKKFTNTKNNEPDMISSFCNILVLNFFISITWIFFRAKNVGEAVEILKKIFLSDYGNLLIDYTYIFKPTVFLILFILAETAAYLYFKHEIISKYPKLKYGLSLTVVTFVILFGTFNHTPFIYFQF